MVKIERKDVAYTFKYNEKEATKIKFRLNFSFAKLSLDGSPKGDYETNSLADAAVNSLTIRLQGWLKRNVLLLQDAGKSNDECNAWLREQEREGFSFDSIEDFDTFTELDRKPRTKVDVAAIENKARNEVAVAYSAYLSNDDDKCAWGRKELMRLGIEVA